MRKCLFSYTIKFGKLENFRSLVKHGKHNFKSQNDLVIAQFI